MIKYIVFFFYYFSKAFHVWWEWKKYSAKKTDNFPIQVQQQIYCKLLALVGFIDLQDL